MLLMNGWKEKMNHKGDIPVVILVIGVFMICGLALFSFYNANSNVRDSFVGIKKMDEMNSQIEQRLFDGQNPTGLSREEKGHEVLDLGQMGKFAYKREIILFSANLTLYLEQ